MRPVKQDRLFSPEGIGNGNCLAACMASLLEIPLWMVPPFDQMFGRRDWYGRQDEWLERMFQLEFCREDGHPVDKLPEFYIAVGRSSRGVLHAVIYSSGALVHDPHPSNEGIISVESVEWLEPIKKA